MRFMVMRITSNDTPDHLNPEKSAMPDEKILMDMMRYNEELIDAGVMLAGEGLHPTATGARITYPGGKPTVTDGPFTEAKEVLGGFWLWQVASKQEAIDWALRCPAGEGAILELRQVQESEEFGEDIARQENALRERMAKNAAG